MNTVQEIWNWITQLGNSKIVALVIFFGTYVGILLYVYSSKRRSKRLESYKYIPLDDEEGADVDKKAESNHEQRD